MRTLFLLGFILGCGPGGIAGDAGQPPGGGGTDAAQPLQWFTTCGDAAVKIDGGHRPSGLPACTTEAAGAPCAPANAECDPQNTDNSYLLCSAQDPKQQPGGCPVSRISAKKDIRYLSLDELRPYRDQLVSLPLATFRYRAAPDGSRLRLGFMIDGHETLSCVDADRGQVDLYSYASMAVAAVKVQAAEIEELRKEVAALRGALEHEGHVASRRAAAHSPRSTSRER